MQWKPFFRVFFLQSHTTEKSIMLIKAKYNLGLKLHSPLSSVTVFDLCLFHHTLRMPLRGFFLFSFLCILLRSHIFSAFKGETGTLMTVYCAKTDIQDPEFHGNFLLGFCY